jgi:hypothetical protein
VIVVLMVVIVVMVVIGVLWPSCLKKQNLGPSPE